MIDLGPRTNKGVALFKLLHQRDESRLFSDEYIEWFLSASQLEQIRRLPSMPASAPADPDERFTWIAYWYTLLRERWVDDLIVRFLERGYGQVVLLGAGFDTRFFRLLEPCDVETFEVDLPGTIDEKSACIERKLGRIPANLHLISRDLSREGIDGLSVYGVHAHVPTIYVMQGLLFYLPPEAAYRLLSEAAPGGASRAIVYDACWPEMTYDNDVVPGIRGQIRKLESIGEPYLFGESPESAVRRLERLGCANVEARSMRDLEMQYLRRGALPDRMWYVVHGETRTA